MAVAIRLSGLLVVVGWLATAAAVAAQVSDNLPVAEEGRDESLYYRSAAPRETRSIIHQKAQARALERQARLASLSWYGMSNSRPTASPTPFTTLYSPVWEMPGGRPYAWYAGSRTGYLFYAR